MEKCYIQLYSLKDKAGKDFVEVLEKVADIGYTGVEFYGGYYGGLSVSEMKKKLEELGLEPLSSHVLSDQVPGQLDYASELGIKYIIDPMSIFSTREEALAFAKKLNETGKLCKEKGIIFGYHNHRHEFLEGEDGYLLETLILNTDPDLVCFQLDVGWATCAGIDVPALLGKYPGRFKLIHAKECSTIAGAEEIADFSKFPIDEGGLPMIPPDVMEKIMEQLKWNVPGGKGIVDWPAVRDAALAQGAEAFIIEREFDYANDIYKCVEEDYKFLKAL